MADKAKTAYEQLIDLLDVDTQSKVKAKLAENPKLIAEDAFTTELFGIYRGVESGATEPATTTTTAATADTTAAVIHTAALPSSATTTAAPTTTTTTSTNDSAAILAALTSLRTSVDDRLKNVMTKDEINSLGAQLLNEATTRALKQADEISMIRETNRKEFGEELNRADFEKFVMDNQDVTTKRNKYATLTDAYNAMVAEERQKALIAKGVEEGVKQKLSGKEVPGQTTTVALSAAQQVMAKAKKDGQAEGGTRLQGLIDRAAQLERSREATVQ